MSSLDETKPLISMSKSSTNQDTYTSRPVDTPEGTFVNQNSTGSLNHSSSSSFQRIKSDVDEVLDLTKKNVEKVMERDGNINNLLQQSEDLEAGAITFNNSSRKLKKQMLCKNVKLWLIIGGIIVGIIVVIIIVAVGHKK